VLFNKLARSSQSLASAVPEGRRAYSLAVDPVSGVSGLVRPGDHVDVLLLTGDDGTKAMAATLFQGVQVLAVGGQYAVDEKGPAEGGNTVSLALTPHECEVALFAQSRGRLHLTLRPTGDDQNVELAAADYSAVLAKVTSGETRRRSSGVEIIKGSSR
jgi:pilus assembly protein CpaB